MGKFDEKVAIVTGGTRGIGREIAVRLAEEGAVVVVNYSRSEADAVDTLEDLRGYNGLGEVMKCDMGDRDAVCAMVGGVVDTFGRIDILVNNAATGLSRPRGAIDSLPNHLHHTMEVNLFGPWFATQEAAKHMGAGGVIVNLLSLGSDRYLPNHAAVGISKGALQT